MKKVIGILAVIGILLMSSLSGFGQLVINGEDTPWSNVNRELYNFSGGYFGDDMIMVFTNDEADGINNPSFENGSFQITKNTEYDGDLIELFLQLPSEVKIDSFKIDLKYGGSGTTYEEDFYLIFHNEYLQIDTEESVNMNDYPNNIFHYEDGLKQIGNEITLNNLNLMGVDAISIIFKFPQLSPPNVNFILNSIEIYDDNYNTANIPSVEINNLYSITFNKKESNFEFKTEYGSNYNVMMYDQMGRIISSNLNLNGDSEIDLSNFNLPNIILVTIITDENYKITNRYYTN